MIYLDFSATTPVDPAVLSVYTAVSLQEIGNPNSGHTPGQSAALRIEAASESIRRQLNATEHEVIYTSGATEANNLAIKGIAAKKRNLGKHVITSTFEHSSVTACFGVLQQQGYEVDFLENDAFGRVRLDSLRALLRPDTILVSVAKVNSEIGMEQPISEIGRILRDYPFVTFHSDMTQAIGKIPVSLADVDLVSFSAHKFFGPKGVGALLRKKTTIVEPLIHGGRSTTDFRSGTPAVPLIAAMESALTRSMDRLDAQFRHVFGLKTYLAERLMIQPEIRMNSNSICIPHIINLSVLPVEAETMMKKLDARGIFVSTQTACHTGGGRSESVFRLTGDEQRAKTSLRISLAYSTTREEIDALVDALVEELPL